VKLALVHTVLQQVNHPVSFRLIIAGIETNMADATTSRRDLARMYYALQSASASWRHKLRRLDIGSRLVKFTESSPFGTRASFAGFRRPCLASDAEETPFSCSPRSEPVASRNHWGRNSIRFTFSEREKYKMQNTETAKYYNFNERQANK